MGLTFSVSLEQNFSSGLSREVLQEFKNGFDKALPATATALPIALEPIIQNAVESSPTVIALQGGDLAQLFAVSIGESYTFATELITALISEISVSAPPTRISGLTLSSDFTVNMLDDSYSNVLAIPSGSYVTQNGVAIPWLSWLLFYGLSPVLPHAKLISTQRGVIAAHADDDLRVLPAYAGVANDNFLTKALDSLNDEITQVIENEISRRL